MYARRFISEVEALLILLCDLISYGKTFLGKKNYNELLWRDHECKKTVQNGVTGKKKLRIECWDGFI